MDQRVKDWIDQINQHGRNLPTWEDEFMEKMTEKFALYGNLSKREVEIVEEIYANKTPL